MNTLGNNVFVSPVSLPDKDGQLLFSVLMEQNEIAVQRKRIRCVIDTLWLLSSFCQRDRWEIFFHSFFNASLLS